MMIDTEESTVRYSRKMPDSWDELLTASNEALERSETWFPSEQSIAELKDVIASVDNETLEESRYYSIGLIACEFAKAIYIPEVRRSAVSWAAHDLVDHHVWSNPRPYLAVGSVASKQIEMPFEYIAENICPRVGRAEIFLANSLHYETDKRQYKDAPDGEWSTPMYTDTVAASAVGANATAATTTLLRLLLEKRLAGADPDKTPVDVDYLQALDIRHLAACLATLRIDEFIRVIDDDEPVAIEVDASEKPSFEKRRMPVGPQQPRKASNDDDIALTPLHQQRLRCPAIHVQRLLPFMQQVVTGILVEADRLIRTGEYAGLAKPDAGKVIVRAMPEEATIIDRQLYARGGSL